MSRTRAHLHSVNENYFQHMRHALGFTLAMLYGAGCCLVHAFFPFLFERKGSTIVQQLHDRMVVNRDKLSRVNGSTVSAQETAGTPVSDQRFAS